MSFIRNINYVQNQETFLGFGASHFNPSPARIITCAFVMDSINAGGINMGQVDVPATPGVEIIKGRNAVNSAGGSSILLRGPVAAVNAALVATTFRSTYYDVDEINQDFLSQDRDTGSRRGELMVQLPASSDVSMLTVGAQVGFSTAANAFNNRFTITRIDTANSGNRIWMIYHRDFNLADLTLAGVYKTLNINTLSSFPCFLRTEAGVNIAPVIDIAVGNPSGNFSFTFIPFDPGQLPAGTFNMTGSPFLAEPVFSVLPPTNVFLAGVNQWTSWTAMGAIFQPDNNFQSVQLLFKLAENDPQYLNVADYTALPGYPSTGTEDQKLLFVGNAINAKASLSIPRYVTDNSSGIVNDVQIGDRASVSYTEPGGVVRWSYYDTAENCTRALSRIAVWNGSSTKDFVCEVRIVNNKARIYANRGK